MTKGRALTMTRLALTRTTPLLLGVLALAACPSDDTPPIDTEGTTTTGDGDTTMPPTTVTMTTTIEPDSGSSATEEGDTTTTGGPVCEPECELGQCCVAGSCFDAGPVTCAAGCGEDEDCVCPEGTDPCECADGAGECIPSACGVAGGYDPCFDEDCPAGSICLVDSVANPTVSWCALSDCMDECDCPLAPEGFEASCDELLQGEPNLCSIACGAGGACPEGMECFQNIACVWPDDGPPPPDPPPHYGDCLNNGGVCDMAMGQVCVSDGATYGWCAILDCADAMACEPPPATGDAPVECIPVNMGMNTVCALDCSMGQTCPDGMFCLGDDVCAWPPPPAPGFDPCVVPETGCAMGQTCLDDGMMDPAWEICAQDCTDVADCTLVPPAGGDAPIACGDPGGSGTDSCYLDCSGGQTCPDGMECFNDSLCAWPQDMALFEDDFETGDLSAGWTLADEDGLTPNMKVDFVDAAWVVSDLVTGFNVAISTSYYMPPGMSDDWLITPAIMLGSNSWLFWASASANGMYPDNLEVLVSTTGNTPADFTDAPVLAVTPESAAGFVAHSVNLAAAGYADVEVYVAFRNMTNDGTLLLVDNVSVVDLP